MKKVLPVIVVSQFFCTSLWFAGNAVIGDVIRQFDLKDMTVAGLTSAVQGGFIIGTLLFAILSVVDRFSPVRIFFTCALVAAFINFCLPSIAGNGPALLLCRSLTGFFLAGIYPVGMKVASDHYKEGLGRSLGFLVGALVLGTAFPHFLKSMMAGLPWRNVIYATSILAAIGGTAMLLLVPDGPDRKPAQQFNLYGFAQSFKVPAFRAAAFGYFGHMWELYAFWAFVPLMLQGYDAHYPAAGINVPLLSFFIITAGSVACLISGLVSQKYGARRTAIVALAISCFCCLMSPFVLFNSNETVFFIFMVIWSMAVIADSPLFSTLIAQNARAEVKGTSITIVNCIGFAITILSIQLLNALRSSMSPRFVYVLLAAGPILGLLAMCRQNSLRSFKI